jgi:hypothetical protein
VVTLVGLIDGNDIFGLFPINPADNVLHAALSALALAVGVASPADDRVPDEPQLVSPGERAQAPARS